MFLKTLQYSQENTCHSQVCKFVEKVLSNININRKSYSTNHVLIRVTENWKKSLYEKKFVGAVLMDLSKAFDSIPHDLLIAKIYAYGFSINAMPFFTHT